MEPKGYVNERDEEIEGDSEQSESDSNESNSENDTELPSERVRYDAQLGQSHLMLGMTFGNAKEASEVISKYVVQFGYKLKLNPNEPLRIVAKCQNEKGCPFMLRISKDRKNPGLAIKTLMAEHRCFRHFLIPSASAKFLAIHFKKKIYNNPAFMVKDMQDEAKELLKINVSLHKCKRQKKNDPSRT